MKNVLADLHNLISELEDSGLTAEASTLQNVFIKVAEDMGDEDMGTGEGDLANDVAALLESHSLSDVLMELAKQSEGGDNISEMASGDNPFRDKPFMVNTDAARKLRKFGPIPDQGTRKTEEEIRRKGGALGDPRGPFDTYGDDSY